MTRHLAMQDISLNELHQPEFVPGRRPDLMPDEISAPSPGGTEKRSQESVGSAEENFRNKWPGRNAFLGPWGAWRGL